MEIGRYRSPLNFDNFRQRGLSWNCQVVHILLAVHNHHQCEVSLAVSCATVCLPHKQHFESYLRLEHSFFKVFFDIEDK